jgi:hypothetical protein
LIFNLDEAWFEVKFTGVDDKVYMESDAIESLTWTDELKSLGSGTLVMDDHSHIYSRIFDPGSTVQISFGILPSLWHAVPVSRSGIKAIVMSPGGAAGSNGDVRYNMNFQSYDFMGDYRTEWDENSTMKQILEKIVVTELKAKPIVDFTGDDRSLRGYGRSETAWRFLVRCADDFGFALFSGYDKLGMPMIAMVDHDKTKIVAENFTGRGSLHLEYGAGGVIPTKYGGDPIKYYKDGSGGPNVISYTWQDNTNNNSSGDGVTLYQGADGKPVYVRRVVENKMVVTYKLVPERVEAAFREKPDSRQQTALFGELIKASSFQSVKKFFDPIPELTAPQGQGIEMTVELLGDPLICAGMVCTFGVGFPDRVSRGDVSYWVRKAQHKFSRSGYTTQVEIVDAYSFSPTGQRLRGSLTRGVL